MHDRHGELFAALTRVVFDSPGSLSPAMRRALADAAPVPAALAPYAQTIRDHAYQVTDSDVAAVIEAGYTEDQVYEMTVSTALGAGMRRMVAGLRAIDESMAGVPVGAEAPVTVAAGSLVVGASVVGAPVMGGPVVGAPVADGSAVDGSVADDSWEPADAVDPAAPPLTRRIPRQAAVAAADASAGAASASIASASIAGAGIAGADIAGADIAGADIAGADIAGAGIAAAGSGATA